MARNAEAKAEEAVQNTAETPAEAVKEFSADGKIDSVDKLKARLTQMREAQQKFARYTQEQVDRIFYEAAMAANHQRVPLAKMAVEETGMGVLEDKVIKNHYASEYIYNKYREEKTCGVIEEDPAFGYKKIAEPLGVIAAVIPTTNPTSTAIFKSTDCIENQKCNYHFSPSACKGKHHCSCEGSAGRSCEGRRSGRNHFLGGRAYD